MFPGQYYDSETQLSQNWHRDYDPTLGRYVQSDPIGLAVGINTYGYAGQNPMLDIDPQGKFFGFPDAWGLALERAGLAELAGGGPEDPFAAVAALALIVGTILVADTPDVEPRSNVIPFPNLVRKSDDCPPDDGCKRAQQELLTRRVVLMGHLNRCFLNIWDYRKKRISSIGMQAGTMRGAAITQ